jgi:hypothetical protein
LFNAFLFRICISQSGRTHSPGKSKPAEQLISAAFFLTFGGVISSSAFLILISLVLLLGFYQSDFICGSRSYSFFPILDYDQKISNPIFIVRRHRPYFRYIFYGPFSCFAGGRGFISIKFVDNYGLFLNN